MRARAWQTNRQEAAISRQDRLLGPSSIIASQPASNVRAITKSQAPSCSTVAAVPSHDTSRADSRVFPTGHAVFRQETRPGRDRRIGTTARSDCHDWQPSGHAAPRALRETALRAGRSTRLAWLFRSDRDRRWNRARSRQSVLASSPSPRIYRCEPTRYITRQRLSQRLRAARMRFREWRSHRLEPVAIATGTRLMFASACAESQVGICRFPVRRGPADSRSRRRSSP